MASLISDRLVMAASLFRHVSIEREVLVGGGGVFVA